MPALAVEGGVAETSRKLAVLLAAAAASSAGANDLTWRKDIGPMIATRCGTCHGAGAPEYNDGNLIPQEKRRSVPRMDSDPHFMSSVVWPATGAMKRRLDDGKAAGGKSGNLYPYLGSSNEVRAGNLKMLNDWLGDGTCNLNHFKARGDMPAITKEQPEKIKAT